ncbi:MAG: hypothetical protein AB4290_01510 [Spirulina sp.]
MNIDKIFRGFNLNRRAIATISLIGVFVLSSLLCFPASARAIDSILAADVRVSFLIAELPTLEEIQDSLKSFAEETQATLEKNLEEANEALQNLPGQLEEAVVKMNAAERERTKKSFAEAQKQLEASAKAYEERAAEAEKLEQELLQSARETREGLKTAVETSKANLESSTAKVESDVKQGIANLKQSFKDTSEAFNILAEDVKRANQETSEFLKQRIEEHKTALDRARKKSDDSLQVLLNKESATQQ